MEKSIVRNSCRSCSSVTSANKKTNVQVLYLGDNGRLTYAGSGRAVSKKVSDKLGISKFNFF